MQTPIPSGSSYCLTRRELESSFRTVRFLLGVRFRTVVSARATLEDEAPRLAAQSPGNAHNLSFAGPESVA